MAVRPPFKPCHGKGDKGGDGKVDQRHDHVERERPVHEAFANLATERISSSPMIEISAVSFMIESM